MTTERIVPPNDLTAEAAVLSTVLLDPERYGAEVIASLHPEHFYSDANAKIFHAMIDLHGRGVPIDILTVRSWLADREMLQRVGGAVYLAEVLDAVPVVSNVKAYCDRVKDKWRLRELIRASQVIAAEAYAHPGEAQSFLDDAEAKIAGVARGQVDKELVPLSVAIKESSDRMEVAARSDGMRLGAPTGFKRLDQVTGGWMATDLILVAARPGMGKTSFAMQAAKTVAEYKGAVFGEPATPNGNIAVVFSLEMPRDQLAMRLVCQGARIDLNRARLGMVTNEELGRMQYVRNELYKLPMYLDDTVGLGPLDLRAKLQRSVAMASRLGYHIALAVVDYLQIMNPQDPAARSRQEQVGSIARALKRTARAVNVPIMALCQLNRGPEEGRGGRRPMLSDLRESGELEQEADVVAFLYREDYYDKDAETKGTCDVIVAKQRNGPTDTIRLAFEKQYTRFDNLSHDEEP